MKHNEYIDTIRMKDIIIQLSDVIFLLCNAKSKDSTVIISQLTNLTSTELDYLHLISNIDSKVKSQ